MREIRVTLSIVNHTKVHFAIMGKSLPATTTATEAIPHPPAYPVLGNVLDLNPEDPMTSIVNLMKRYGPIMAMKFPKQPKPVIMVGSQELVHELCDQERFIKNVSGALEEVRAVAKDGTCRPSSPTPRNWLLSGANTR